MHKLQTYIYIIIAIILNGSYSYGQFMPMHTPQGTYMMPYGSGSKSYRLKVTLLDSSIRIFYSRFYIDRESHKQYIKQKKDKIFPGDTKYISRQYFKGSEKKVLTGLPEDSVWLFTIYDGKIKCLYNEPDHKTASFSYLEKEERKRYDIKTLKLMLSDDPLAMKMFKRRSTYRIVGYGIISVMLGGFIAGGVNLQYGSGMELMLGSLGGIFVGVGFAASSYYQHIKAIKVYNGEI